MNLPANIDTARLPETYEAAKVALSECAKIDECWEWADRAAALASYARQADDTTLEVMAKRIRGRAVRRAGELLKMVESRQGARTDLVGAPLQSRKQAASDAGMSKDQAVTAIRVANVPEAEFDSWIEGDDPPTVTALAKEGTKRRKIIDLGDRDPKQFNAALHFIGDLENAARLMADLKMDVVDTLTDEERAKVRRVISKIDALADQVMTRVS